MLVTSQQNKNTSVVIPVLNESELIESTLSRLIDEQDFQEIIVVDGGSNDNTISIVTDFIGHHDSANGCRLMLLRSAAGRALQMNKGANRATSQTLLFLHADTTLPDNTAAMINKALSAGRLWGRFDVRLDSEQSIFRLIEYMMNLRSAWTGIVTGDQAIFIDRGLFRRKGGFADIVLMEDIEFSRRLKRDSWPVRLRAPVVTSARRWQHRGIIRTMMLMWWLRLLYWFGVKPDRLVKRYYS
jgi:rSAM/selenodomain-associated transferase 2